jgi:hypothetical protein
MPANSLDGRTAATSSYTIHADDPGLPDRSCGSLRIVVLQRERPELRGRCIEIDAHGIHPLESHL